MKEHLDVEPEPCRALERKYLVGKVASEHLEAALGVLEASDGHQTDDPVEYSAHQVPYDRLAEPSRPLRLTRADDDVVALRHAVKKVVEVLHRHGHIGIAHEAKLALRLEHPMTDGESLAGGRQ